MLRAAKKPTFERNFGLGHLLHVTRRVFDTARREWQEHPINIPEFLELKNQSKTNVHLDKGLVVSAVVVVISVCRVAATGVGTVVGTVVGTAGIVS